jgi:hypothetical protein
MVFFRQQLGSRIHTGEDREASKQKPNRQGAILGGVT